MQTVTLKVQGMSCGHCINSIEGALKQMGAEGKVDLNNDLVTATFDEAQLSLESIKEAIEEQGYEVE